MVYEVYLIQTWGKKIVFESHSLIDAKLCQPTFNYFKFYVISHFIQYI